MHFNVVLNRYRNLAYSEKDKGTRFEVLIKHYLKTDPLYVNEFETVWLWSEFPYKDQFGGKDIGIDIIAQGYDKSYTAIQCKCYQENTKIDKPEVDTFLSTSGKHFKDKDNKDCSFLYRFWVSTTNKWTDTAEETLRNQHPAVYRIGLTQLENANVNWEEIDKGIYGLKAQIIKKEPLGHQKIAIEEAHKYFASYDRGKLIMACGTGKTFTSLKIAENETNNNGTILFLVPSIALLGQTLNEWSSQAQMPINPICICSDPESTKKQVKNNDDSDDVSVIDLALPASTNIENIKQQYKYFKKNKTSGMTVIFSTYQSIDVISKVQMAINAETQDGLIFDLVICDEAHRTTGVILKGGQEETAFTKVHDNNIIKARKRMYMTATPRLYKDNVKEKAKENDVILCSMDDKSIYGDEIYRIGFGEAVDKHLLSDYKVLVLTLSEKDIPNSLQHAVANPDYEITADDAAKIVGCINALSKRVVTEITYDGIKNNLTEIDPGFMHRAVAFCSTISASKKITEMFKVHGNDYYKNLSAEERNEVVSIVSDHIDGSMGAATRDEKLCWLKSAPSDGKECRILTNVRCLSEGVDVPSLDAVLFLSAKNSQVDVVQSVGRVMRKAEGKKFGYIIIPVIIPSDISPEEALNNNERFKVVWNVLNALKAHDDRFNAEINKIELNKKKSDKIIVSNVLSQSSGDSDFEVNLAKNNSDLSEKMLTQLQFQFCELQDMIYAKMVKKVGNRQFWEQWAKDIAEIARKHVIHITNLSENGKYKQEFDIFLKGIQKQLNPAITKEEAIEMLAQHLITRPVFEALFGDYSFVKNNPVSQAMQKVLDILDENAMDKGQEETLGKFYKSVQDRVEGITNSEGKQRIMIELYDKFFKTALPKTVEKLGIVYTPVEVVDFILNSVSDVLKKEFNRSLSDENVHILDPFTGTGTFITRLLQGGFIDHDVLNRKYLHEIHANEIVLLAYYIASVNIENTYHDIMQLDEYQNFEGICLTDTFQMTEYDDKLQLSELFPKNSERLEKQKKCPLTIIIGNPPYSVGQKSENDNAKNQKYEKLDNQIANTYVKYSNAKLNKGLYDSYIKAFRWASENIDKNGGIIGFITNSGWLDGNGMDGFRYCLEREFSSVYVLNLRGAIRGKIGDSVKKEGQNVFDIQTGVAITILVKNPNKKREKAVIYYHDIGDYLTKQEKFDCLKDISSVANDNFNAEILTPNKENDWINLRNDCFNNYYSIGDKDEKNEKKFFNIYSGGLSSNRDFWVYNFSKTKLIENVKNTIDFYNEQRKSYASLSTEIEVEKFIDTNPAKISWTRQLKKDLKLNKEKLFVSNSIYTSMYRPFQKQFVYFNKELNECIYQQSKLYPANNYENLCIILSGTGSAKPFSCLITNCVPNLDTLEKAQCFPLYWYEEKEKSLQKSLFGNKDDNNDKYIRRDGISDFIHNLAKEKYGHKITKEDIFYYVYGILHSKDYRTKFAADLKKMLPRIPLVDKVEDFLAFSQAGRNLAKLHLNYENQFHLPSVNVTGDEFGSFIVDKMKFKNKEDKSEIIYNNYIKISDIPKSAYDYVINGRSAIEWVMERYQVKTDNDSQITNDPNDWAKQHNQPRYILDLLLSIISLSVATTEIVNSLPKLSFEETKEAVVVK